MWFWNMFSFMTHHIMLYSYDFPMHRIH
jgi:hypothetical protein